MASISSYSSSSATTSTSSKRLSGFMSGLDTDELVKQMTAATRTKIATQQQKKQKAQWQQEAYRAITKKINDFQNKWLTYSAGSNNILSANFFKTATITSSSSYLKVSGDANVAKNIQIRDIKALAQTESYTSTVKLSKGAITTGTILTERYASLVSGSSISLEYGGKTYKVEVGADFNLTGVADNDEARLQAILDELNQNIAKNADLAGKLSFSTVQEDGKTLVQLTSNDGKVKIAGGTTELLSGLGLSASAEGSSLKGATVIYSDLFEYQELGKTLAGSSITVSLNGLSKTITFDQSKESEYDTPEKLTEYLNNALAKAYGKDKVTVSNDNGKLTFKTDSDTSIFTITGSDNKKLMSNDGVLQLSKSTSNRVMWNQPIKSLSEQLNGTLTPNANGEYEITINGETITFSGDDTLSTVFSKINNSNAGVTISYSTTTDVVSIFAKESGSHGRVEVKANSNGCNFGALLFGDQDITHEMVVANNTAGRDAVVNISFDGGKTFTDVTRSSNSFSLDGVNFELLGMAEGDTQENITFTVENNIDELVKKITDFLKDYNEIVKLCSDSVSERPDRNYAPLTDEQRKDMTEEQIKNWEQKAKQGILSNDSTINQFLINLRSAMTGIVEGPNSALYKFGITSTDWTENGQLHIDEEKLRTALTEKAEEFRSLFTNVSVNDNDRENGLATRLSNVLNSMAGTFGGDGLLIQIAGKANATSASQDRITLQIKDIDRQISALKTRLQSEEERYYKQFTTLETYLSKLNMQASWLTSSSDS